MLSHKKSITIQKSYQNITFSYKTYKTFVNRANIFKRTKNNNNIKAKHTHTQTASPPQEKKKQNRKSEQQNEKKKKK